MFYFFFSSRRLHTRSTRDWSSDVCSSDLLRMPPLDRISVPASTTRWRSQLDPAANPRIRKARPKRRDHRCQPGSGREVLGETAPRAVRARELDSNSPAEPTLLARAREPVTETP